MPHEILRAVALKLGANAMNKKFAAVAGTLAACAAVPASAADLPRAVYKAPPAAVTVYNWTGFHVGGGGGYGAFTNTELPSTTNNIFPHAATTAGGKGGFATIAAGYDLQFASRWVAGVFADYDFSDIKGESIRFGEGVTARKLTSSWAAGGRVGYLVSPGSLLYASAGYSQAEFENTRKGFRGGPWGSETGSRHDGWFVGAGIEALLGSNWFGRVEYRYAEYDTQRSSVLSDVGVLRSYNDSTPAIQTVRAGILYKFGGPGPGSAPVHAAPVLSPAFSWTGLYLGAGGGYGAYTSENNFQFSSPPFAPPLNTLDSGGKGGLATVVVGYDMQFADRFVAGIFADYDFAGLEGTYTQYSPSLDQFSVGTLKQTSAWAVGGRAGILVTPATLLYGTGGYTQADFDSVAMVKSTVNAPNFNPVQPGATFKGWFAGAGAETQLAANWSARLEYRYAEYDTERLLVPMLPTALVDAAELKPTIQTVRATINYKFGLGRGVTAKD